VCMTWLIPCRCCFQERTWQRILVLLVGTLLARGRRTVTAALRQLGHQDDPHFSRSHQVFNRASWSLAQASPILFSSLLRAFCALDQRLVIALDETLERRCPRAGQREKLKQRGEKQRSGAGGLKAEERANQCSFSSQKKPRRAAARQARTPLSEDDRVGRSKQIKAKGVGKGGRQTVERDEQPGSVGWTGIPSEALRPGQRPLRTLSSGQG
jgi:hypothetical protein